MQIPVWADSLPDTNWTHNSLESTISSFPNQLLKVAESIIYDYHHHHHYCYYYHYK